MKKRLLFTIVTLLSFAVVLLHSCKKNKGSDRNDADKFVGRWTGPSSCLSYGFTTEAEFTGSGTSIQTMSTIGYLCQIVVTLDGFANGDSIVFPAQTFLSSCGEKTVVSGTGILTDSTLEYTEIYVSTGSNVYSNFSDTCLDYLKKQ